MPRNDQDPSVLAQFRNVLGEYVGVRGSAAPHSASELIEAFQRTSAEASGDGGAIYAIYQYLSGNRVPDPRYAYRLGQALGQQNDQFSPAGLNNVELSGPLLLAAAGHLTHLVTLIAHITADSNDPVFRHVLDGLGSLAWSGLKYRHCSIRLVTAVIAPGRQRLRGFRP